MINHMRGFLAFVRSQGVAGLAIAFIFGAAISGVVSSLVNDIANPLLGLLFGQVNGIRSAAWHVGSATIGWGNFVATLINFLIIALVIYAIVKIFRLDLPGKKE